MDKTNHQNENNITSPNQLLEDINSDKSLRPLSFNDFIGQEKIVDNLKVYIEAAKQRAESLDHVLLFGPPGLGKTTLANIIAEVANLPPEYLDLSDDYLYNNLLDQLINKVLLEACEVVDSKRPNCSEIGGVIKSSVPPAKKTGTGTKASPL